MTLDRYVLDEVETRHKTYSTFRPKNIAEGLLFLSDIQGYIVKMANLLLEQRDGIKRTFDGNVKCVFVVKNCLPDITEDQIGTLETLDSVCLMCAKCDTVSHTKNLLSNREVSYAVSSNGIFINCIMRIERMLYNQFKDCFMCR